MQITRNSRDTTPGPPDWFTGSVFIDTITAPTEPSRLGAAGSTSRPAPARPGTPTPSARRSTSPRAGLCQREDGPIEVIKPGDRVYFEAGENHWHGAAPNRFMTHIAMQEADDSGSPVVWGRHVTDQEYATAPSSDTGEH
jgi:hypothetical protein